jgi:hypothetical protein
MSLKISPPSVHSWRPSTPPSKQWVPPFFHFVFSTPPESRPPPVSRSVLCLPCRGGSRGRPDRSLAASSCPRPPLRETEPSPRARILSAKGPFLSLKASARGSSRRRPLSATVPAKAPSLRGAKSSW